MKRTLMIATLTTLLGWGTLAEEATVTTATRDTLLSASAATRGAGLAHHFGAGLLLGEPTGASLKYFLTNQTAIDGAIGWGFHRESDFYVHSDFLWHKHDVFYASEGQWSLYFGIGARVKFRDHAEDRVGLRAPVGLSYTFEQVPVDVFVEVAPILDFAPSVSGGFTAGIGARYWF